jgi:hypothetical protein
VIKRAIVRAPIYGPGFFACEDISHPGEWAGGGEPIPGVTYAWDGRGTSWAVDNMQVTKYDAVAVAAAVREVRDAPRHGPEGDAARERAGRAAMSVGDAMIRARLLDAVDGWSAVMGRIVDGSWDGPDGILCEPTTDEFSVRLLGVVCPSTGRRYVHGVPRNCATARDARRWIMRIDRSPEVET